ncbi:MAG: ATP-binding protein [Gemmatimonadota bacterium]|nr:ATP-binding protein [Gemmatimonadota bacterium]
MTPSHPATPDSPDAREAPRPAAARGFGGRWRALPLTAQLLILGMLVSLLWFLTARLASDRQEAATLDRNERRAELRRADESMSRMGTALLRLSRAHLAFLATGRPAFLDEVAGEHVSFEVASAQLVAEGGRPWLARATRELADTLRLWVDSAHLPAVRRRQQVGLRAFESGSPDAVRILAGTGLMARLLERQAAVQRELRRERDAVVLESEQAEAREAWDSLVIRIAALAVFVLLLTLIMRLVGRAMGQVVDAARALEAGHYREAHFPSASQAPNLETAQLAATFEQLASSIEQRERQLQDDIEKLTELERLKRDFVSTVSHELRTPLTSIRGALGLILGGKVGDVPPRGLDLLQIAKLNTDRLIRLINDILDVEKMDSGQIEVRRDRLHLRPLVQTTLAGIEAFAREHGTEVRLVSPPEADVEIVGDADRIVQVFTNLVSNAVKYSPDSGVVDVSITVDGDRVSVRVRDHGPGIAPEFAGRIFGRFQQSADPAMHRSGGTGLGLSIAKAIVELHGGRIGFESAEGGGTVFWVTLPAVAPLERVADPRRAILIIEDDPSMRDVLVAQFESLARPIPVQSAEAAQALLEREEVAAIIVDPGLPGMDGLAFARWIRKSERHRKMPMFLYSAREFDPDELRASGIRAADAFVKSRDSEQILFERMRHELAKQAPGAAPAGPERR